MNGYAEKSMVAQQCGQLTTNKIHNPTVGENLDLRIKHLEA